MKVPEKKLPKGKYTFRTKKKKVVSLPVKIISYWFYGKR